MSTSTVLPDLEQAARDMPFDQFGRYHMLREAVGACRTKLNRPALSILDVGGFYEDNGRPTLPIQRFLPLDSVTVVDIVECDLPGYVQGDGTSLDFDTESFDLVVSADTLEHIPQPRRAAFWNEILRVARHAVILLAPFATPEVDAAEELLFGYIKAELGAEHQQLKEHREFGLPRQDEWLALLAEQQISARSYPTGYLHAWLGMMLLKHLLLRINANSETQQQIDWYYNRCFFPTERRSPAYRHMIVAEKSAGLIDAVDIVLAPTIMPEHEDAADWGRALVPTMLALFQRQVATIRTHEAEQQAAALEEAKQQRAVLESVIAEQRQQAITQAHVIAEQRERLSHLRHETSFLERLVADQQGMINQLQGQLHALHDLTRAQAESFEATIADLTARAHWFESQARANHQLLEAVQKGRVMRLLNRLSGRA